MFRIRNYFVITMGASSSIDKLTEERKCMRAEQEKKFTDSGNALVVLRNEIQNLPLRKDIDTKELKEVFRTPREEKEKMYQILRREHNYSHNKFHHKQCKFMLKVLNEPTAVIIHKTSYIKNTYNDKTVEITLLKLSTDKILGDDPFLSNFNNKFIVRINSSMGCRDFDNDPKYDTLEKALIFFENIVQDFSDCENFFENFFGHRDCTAQFCYAFAANAIELSNPLEKLSAERKYVKSEYDKKSEELKKKLVAMDEIEKLWKEKRETDTKVETICDEQSHRCHKQELSLKLSELPKKLATDMQELILRIVNEPTAITIKKTVTIKNERRDELFEVTLLQVSDKFFEDLKDKFIVRVNTSMGCENVDIYPTLGDAMYCYQKFELKIGNCSHLKKHRGCRFDGCMGLHPINFMYDDGLSSP